MKGVLVSSLVEILVLTSILSRVNSQYLLDICEQTNKNLYIYGPNERHNITSPPYIDGAKPTDGHFVYECSVLVKGCFNCKIIVRILQLNIPDCYTSIPTGDECRVGCNHVIIYDEFYRDQTIQHYHGNNTAREYTSKSSNVRITLCMSDDYRTDPNKNVFMQVLSTDLTFRYYGTNGKDGYLTTPGYPRSYKVDGEIYTYIITNSDENGVVRVTFDDWDLYSGSRIQIYDGPAANDSYFKMIDQRGHGTRPFIQSTRNALSIRFRTGAVSVLPYHGFKAHYQFLKYPEALWDNRPDSRYDKVFTRRGDLLHVNGQYCQGHMDTLITIKNYQTNDFPQIALNVTRFDMATVDSLIIIAGNTSEAPIIDTLNGKTLFDGTSREYISSSGFLLRIRWICAHFKSFTAHYSIFRNGTAGNQLCPQNSYKCSGNKRCIPYTLACNDLDFCGDGSNRLPECMTTTTTTTARMCPIGSYACRDGLRCYREDDRCTGYRVCNDGDDEEGCPPSTPGYTSPSYNSYLSTYLPIGITLSLFVIILCVIISCCTSRKEQRRRRRRAGLSTITRTRRTSDLNETQIDVNISIRQPMSPPAYEEVVMYNSNTGALNMGYSVASNSELDKPPAYSELYDNNLPVHPVGYSPSNIPSDQLSSPPASNAAQSRSGNANSSATNTGATNADTYAEAANMGALNTGASSIGALDRGASNVGVLNASAVNTSAMDNTDTTETIMPSSNTSPAREAARNVRQSANRGLVIDRAPPSRYRSSQDINRLPERSPPMYRSCGALHMLPMTSAPVRRSSGHIDRHPDTSASGASSPPTHVVNDSSVAPRDDEQSNMYETIPVVPNTNNIPAQTRQPDGNQEGGNIQDSLNGYMRRFAPNANTDGAPVPPRRYRGQDRRRDSREFPSNVPYPNELQRYRSQPNLAQSNEGPSRSISISDFRMMPVDDGTFV
ncbi:unnamed protein product [Owenia fusiformis]|uniref:Uncharacterized protein n=1 Tax=Owenia fusiformis TaxID=6347 RepID=A0A8J1TYP4_OWEFU|nr:unnamed protein product [Owenia fusiformis]